MRNLILGAAVALATAFGALVSPGTAAAAEKTFIVVTSDDPQTQAMAMILGHQAIGHGTEVRVLLCGPGGDMALKGAEMPTLKGPDATPQQLLSGLVKKGATAEVCGIYLPNSTHTAEDLIEGVSPVKPPVIGEYMAQPDVRYFTF
ncbi:hypothetical protein C882_3408 [Caenispirillum salinarum AK4]|uniref:Uncharacterized protein n=1 Tax=Caenispirillum salinarum AK4 TaxID=1238182 RepID=K9HMZ5_9PROT|nr:DsrE family protein [Caenispirillum salinarum]EKV31658.1 hypothetical protein C882_3408 [Caenispirillum salinarum AK4]